MELNKCQRCGNFFATKSDICPNCVNKETAEISTLKKFFSENSCDEYSLEDISSSTGISMKNLNRFASNEELNSFIKLDNTKTFGNVSINL